MSKKKKKASRTGSKQGPKKKTGRRKGSTSHLARQERFAREYLIDGNATQAALRAGYARSGAGVQGDRLLKNAHVREIIEAGQKKTAERLEITRERVLQELAEIGFGVVGLHHEEMGEIDMRSWGKDEAAVAQAKRAALDSIARILGFVAPKKHEHTGPGGGPIEVADPMEQLGRVPIEVRRRYMAALAELQAAAEEET